MKGIIIDGVSSSGKTSILRHLHSKISEEYPSSTKFFISEHYTERMLEHLKESNKLTGTHVKKHVESIITTFKTFQDMLDSSKFANNPRSADIFVTMERFILTHMVSADMENIYTTYEAKQHLKILNKMGMKQVILVIPEKNFKEKLMSTLAYRNDAWKNHLCSLGDEQEIVSYYKKWQKDLLSYSKEFGNAIDTLTIEIKDDDYVKYSDIIFDYCFKEEK